MTMTTTSSRQWPLGQFRKHTMILVSELFQVPCFHSDHFFQCFLNPIDITFQVDLDCQSEISSWKLVNIIKRIQPNHSFSNSTALSLQINVLVFYADSEEHFFMQIRGAFFYADQRSRRNRKLDPGHVSSALLPATNHSNVLLAKCQLMQIATKSMS